MYARIPGTHAAGFSTVTVRGGNRLSEHREGGRERRASTTGRRHCFLKWSDEEQIEDQKGDGKVFRAKTFPPFFTLFIEYRCRILHEIRFSFTADSRKRTEF